jgi:hypothetical protein
MKVFHRRRAELWPVFASCTAPGVMQQHHIRERLAQVNLVAAMLAQA